MFNIEFDDQASQSLLQNLTQQLFDNMKPLIDKQREHDEIVNQTYLQKNVFHCRAETMAAIVNTAGFPRMQLGDKENYSYSLKAVDEWVKNNQLRN